MKSVKSALASRKSARAAAAKARGSLVPGRFAPRAGIAAVAVTGSIVVQIALAPPTLALTPAAGVVAKSPAVEVTAVNASRLPSGPTSWPALNRAIATIPSYRRGVATWVVDNAYGHYGATNLATRQIHIARTVPTSRLFSVAAHEYGHALTAVNYAGNEAAANAGLARYFRSGTTMNREYAADCMAILMGARWTHYTRCGNARWRFAAATLLHGGRL